MVSGPDSLWLLHATLGVALTLGPGVIVRQRSVNCGTRAGDGHPRLSDTLVQQVWEGLALGCMAGLPSVTEC